ncbi:MAG: hypothetical protein RL701_7578, partial [Pseudomonadota bacterium]
MPEPRFGSWQERDINELRAREASYRERLSRQAVLAERLQRHSEALQRLLRERPPSRAHLSATLLEVAKLSSLALETRRTSIWLFDPDATSLHCSIQLVDHLEVTGNATESISIDCANCPTYVAMLSETHALSVEDVYANSATIELHEYLRERNIGALLDIPVHIPGSLLGVVCHEHVGGPRVWDREEIEFAANVGSLVALALETERRLSAEYAARGTEAKYRNLVESLPVTVYAFDLHTGKLDYVSPRAFELGGWPAEQWLAAGVQPWLERIHPDDRASVLARFDPGAVKGFPPELTYRVNLPDGQVRWVRDTCSLVRDQVGRSIALQGMLSDVTQQVESELERIELERRHRFMLDHADLHAVMLDCNGIVTFVNDYLCRMTGFSRSEILGHSWFEFTAPPSERVRLQAEYTTGIVRGWFEPRMEGPLRTAHGGRRHVLWTTTLLRRTDGAIQGVSGLGVDLTQRLQLEAELQQQTKIDSLGRLAAGVAHDFNNLLIVMQHETEQLGAFVNGSDGSGAGRVSRAQQHAKTSQRALHDALAQAAELTHSLLVYGRQGPVRKEAVAVDELVQDSLRLVESMAGADLTVTTALHSEHAAVLLDRAQLRQVILNLVGNAADALRRPPENAAENSIEPNAHTGSIRISTHRELIEASTTRHVGQAQSGEYAVLTVADDGCGMDERTLTRIFEPFFTTKTPGRGTGLGLAMCESIVDRAGGFINVESEPGKGTRFRVYLPTAPGASAASASANGIVAASLNASPTKNTASARGRSGARILVVDDVAGIRNLLVMGLRECGYHVYDAASVAAAKQILATQPIDLLVTDGMLPDGSGIVLARSARTVQPGLKIVLISGSFETSENFDAVLLKPFDTDQFLQVVA